MKLQYEEEKRAKPTTTNSRNIHQDEETANSLKSIVDQYNRTNLMLDAKKEALPPLRYDSKSIQTQIIE